MSLRLRRVPLLGWCAGACVQIHGLIDENVHFRHTARLIHALITARKVRARSRRAGRAAARHACLARGVPLVPVFAALHRCTGAPRPSLRLPLTLTCRSPRSHGCDVSVPAVACAHCQRYELFLLPDERHGPRSPADRAYVEMCVEGFFKRTLGLGDPAPAASSL